MPLVTCRLGNPNALDHNKTQGEKTLALLRSIFPLPSNFITIDLEQSICPPISTDSAKSTIFSRLSTKIITFFINRQDGKFLSLCYHSPPTQVPESWWQTELRDQPDATTLQYTEYQHTKRYNLDNVRKYATGSDSLLAPEGFGSASETILGGWTHITTTTTKGIMLINFSQRFSPLTC